MPKIKNVAARDAIVATCARTRCDLRGTADAALSMLSLRASFRASPSFEAAQARRGAARSLA
jgi:hypothetical protein